MDWLSIRSRLNWACDPWPCRSISHTSLRAFRDAISASLSSSTASKTPDPQQVFLVCSDEGRRERNAQPLDLCLEVVGHVLGAMIVAQSQPGGDILVDDTEPVTSALCLQTCRLARARPQGAVLDTRFSFWELFGHRIQQQFP